MNNRHISKVIGLLTAAVLVAGCGATAGKSSPGSPVSPTSEGHESSPMGQVTIFLELESDLPMDEHKRLTVQHDPELKEVEGLLQKYYASHPETGQLAAAMIWAPGVDTGAYLETEGYKRRMADHGFKGDYRVLQYALIDTLREHELAPAGPQQVAILVSGLVSELGDDALRKKALERKPMFLEVDGLLQKYYLKNKEDGSFAGFYIFDSKEAATAYKSSPLKATIAEAYKLTAPPQITVLGVGARLHPTL